MRAEVEREAARLKLVKEQVKALEAARCNELAGGKQPLVVQLARLRAIGPKGAWILVKEVFGWRRFANCRCETGRARCPEAARGHPRELAEPGRTRRSAIWRPNANTRFTKAIGSGRAAVDEPEQHSRTNQAIGA